MRCVLYVIVCRSTEIVSLIEIKGGEFGQTEQNIGIISFGSQMTDISETVVGVSDVDGVVFEKLKLFEFVVVDYIVKKFHQRAFGRNNQSCVVLAQQIHNVVAIVFDGVKKRRVAFRV